MWQLLEWLRGHGLNESAATAGLLGGTVRGFIIRGGWVNGIISALVGAICANYFTTPIALSPTLNVFNWSEGAIGFLIGMGAMLVSELYLKNLGNWITSKFGGAKP